MYTCMCNWITLLNSRKLPQHCKPAIMEKMKIIINEKRKPHKNPINQPLSTISFPMYLPSLNLLPLEA